MSVRRCIPGLLSSGAFTRDQAERAEGLFDELEKDYSTKFGKQAAEAMASEETAKRLEQEAALKKRQSALQIKAQQQIAADVRLFKGDNPGASAEALLASDDRAPYFNVEFRAQAIANEHLAMMNGILEQHSRNVIGQVRDVAGLHDVLREAFGENTGNAAARELADAWLQTAESLRLRFNAEGGAIGKLEKWGMPQVHNMLAVRSVSFDEWRDFILPKLDLSRMQDHTGNPMTPQQVEASLKGVYDTIISDGWNQRRAGAFVGSKLANRHGDSRFLIFKGADDWLAYHEKFGRPLSSLSERIDPGAAIFDTMIGHIHGMSRDIALMQRLGPNPAATIRWITDGLKIEASRPDKPASRIKQAKKSAIRVNNMFTELTGGWDIEDETLAKIGQGVRAWESAAKLGGAVLSSTGDVATQYVTRRFNGLPAIRVVSDYVGSLRPSSAADRAHAARQLFIAERATRTMGAYSRWTGETINGEIPARLSDAVMQLSYLSKWTDDGKRLFNHQVWAAITDNAGKNWDTLAKDSTDRRFRAMLERYGLGREDWEAIRHTPLEEDGGAQWILPKNIDRPELRTRLAEMILQETEFAVPSSSLRIRAAINSRLHKGSIPGEIGRLLLQFRGFPMQLFWMNGRRALAQGGVNALRYLGSLYIANTIAGGLAMQLKAIVSGKEPYDMTDWHFWAKASLQGGGLGIVGDFIGGAVDRAGHDFWVSQLGPTAGTISDAIDVLHSKHKARALQRLIQNNLPGSTLWYIRLAFQREILDQIQAQIDPEYWDSFSRMERRAKQDGTSYWWRPGQAKPERAPDLTQAGGK